MAGIQGMPTPKPKDLPSPVPQEASPAEAAGVNVGVDLGALSNIGGPGPQMQEAPTFDQFSSSEGGAPSFDQFLAMEEAGGAEAQGADQEIQMSEMPDPQGMELFKEQLRETHARFRNAWTTTPAEQVETLKPFIQQGIFEDVIQSGNKVLVKRPGRGGYEPFDREKFEIIGDTLDLARMGFESTVMGSVQTLATMAGFAGGNVPGGAAGFAAGGAAGAALAHNAGEGVARLMRIPKDPARSELTEQGMVASLGALFGVIGGNLAARRAAREATQAANVKSFDHAIQKVRDTADDIDMLQKSGIQLADDGKFRMDPQQMLGGKGVNAEIDQRAVELSDDPQFRNFRREVGDTIKNGYQSLIDAFKTQAKAGVDVAKNIGDDFKLTSKEIRAIEGKHIETFRGEAQKILQFRKQPTPQLFTSLQALDGFKDVRQAPLELGIHNGRTAGAFLEELNKTRQYMAKSGGQMQLGYALELQKRWTNIIENNIDSIDGRPMAFKMIDLRNALRDDINTMMETAFSKMSPPGQGQAALMGAYQKSVQSYRSIMEATRELGPLIEKDNITRTELLKKMFEGNNSKNFSKNMKTLLDNSDQGRLWDRLSSDYLTMLRDNFTDGDKVNWNGLTKKWKGIDPEVKDMLLQGAGMKGEVMDSLLRLGQATQNSEFTYAAKDGTKTMAGAALKNLMVWFGGLVGQTPGGAAAKGNTLGDLLSGVGKNESLQKWLKEGGIEQVLRDAHGLSPVQKSFLREQVSNLVIKPITSAPAKDMVKAQTRRTLVEE